MFPLFGEPQHIPLELQENIVTKRQAETEYDSDADKPRFQSAAVDADFIHQQSRVPWVSAFAPLNITGKERLCP